MRGRCLLALLALGPATPGWGAARARLGGTLALGLVGLAPPAPEGPADSPEEASARALLALPLCRLFPKVVPVLATVERTPAGPEEWVEVRAKPEARFLDGAALGARDVADAWRRLLLAHSPYASLLLPVAHLEETLQTATQHPEAPLRLRLLYPWPDFEASLCHPAFTPTRAGAQPAQGVGLYAPRADGRLVASSRGPGGPPFPASLSFQTLPGRTAARLLQRGEVHAVLGEATGQETPTLLYATYLVYAPGRLPEGVLSVLAHVDWTALVRTFVPGPAAPLVGLLPPALGEAAVAPLPAKPPAAAGTAAASRSFRLGYEVGVAEQRAVGERLQVLLHDAGYSVRLVPDSHANLARAQAAGTLEAALVSVLLPPLAAPALAVVLGLVAETDGVAKELRALGAEADTEARSAKARARASELAPALPLVPLYVRGLRAQLSAGLLDARRDAFGLLVLDDVWLAH